MNKMRKYLKTEADVEFFACTHGASTIFMYGLMQWLGGIDDVPFSIIFQQMVLGYVISWTQKGLFLREKSYTRREYQIREILWCLIPGCLMVLTGIVFQWFPDVSWGITVAFYVIMACYFIMIWLFLKYIYREETKEMNELLKQRKQREELL